ncbi:hypothetical protein D9619_010808 [Psilocybe cf. subviscida]|uniref:Uncharacterized protein n=1 Tax=Psilocybe cf. subviscida TaxID=2480587 RepID=A0A8H5B825_9AGAR|nr:hypothetical protein D9619_010808 [Psilocybe cf. subviscida]
MSASSPIHRSGLIIWRPATGRTGESFLCGVPYSGDGTTRSGGGISEELRSYGWERAQAAKHRTFSNKTVSLLLSLATNVHKVSSRVANEPARSSSEPPTREEHPFDPPTPSKLSQEARETAHSTYVAGPVAERSNGLVGTGSPHQRVVPLFRLQLRFLLAGFVRLYRDRSEAEAEITARDTRYPLPAPSTKNTPVLSSRKLFESVLGMDMMSAIRISAGT